MKPPQGPHQSGPLNRRRADHPAWLLVLAALLFWQAWLTLGLFGSEQPWQRLLNAEPIISGRHPLHLYHGSLGARSFYDHGTLSCYDPAFNAGYPKTAVFDSGSRPAELMLLLGGGRYNPAAYKIGLALSCAAAAWLLAVAARGAGFSWLSTCAATGLGILVWWSKPWRELLEAGDLDLLLGSVLVLAHFGLLIRYHRAPGPASLLGIVVTGFLGWFAHPLLLALLLPLFLIYYVTVGTRHPLFWHLGLLPGLIGSLAANAFWLRDFLEHWWILLPLQLDAARLAHRTLSTVWQAALWGTPLDRALGCIVLASGLAGVVLLNQTGQRAAARLFGLAFAGFFLIALLSLLIEPLGRLGAPRLFAPALLFASLPAGYALTEGLFLAWRWLGWGGVLAIPAALAGFVWVTTPESLTASWDHFRAPRELQIGLGEERFALLEALRANTNTDARILWEDRFGSRPGPRWTALLAVLTERAYVGGLDPDAGIEHLATGLMDQTLAGRALKDWTRDEWDDYCKRYNIGWVVCWHPATRAKIEEWSRPEQTPLTLPAEGEGQGEGEGWLIALPRKPSFTLRGSATWVAADAQRIVLEDMRPEDGQVLLSLHYQKGLRVTPSRVQLERAEDRYDHVDFVRLRIADPSVSRVTITWEKR